MKTKITALVCVLLALSMSFVFAQDIDLDWDTDDYEITCVADFLDIYDLWVTAVEIEALNPTYSAYMEILESYEEIVALVDELDDDWTYEELLEYQEITNRLTEALLEFQNMTITAEDYMNMYSYAYDYSYGY